MKDSFIDLSSRLRNPDNNIWLRWQAFWVNAIKSRALGLFHRVEQGEFFLLRIYYLAELISTKDIARELADYPIPEWLRISHRQHLKEEGQHIRLFAQALQSRGAALPEPVALDWFSQRKVEKIRAIAKQYRNNFVQGDLVCAYAIALCAEQLTCRVLSRHCRVIGQSHAMYPLLNQVLQDELRHEGLCIEALKKLLEPNEYVSLQSLLTKIRSIETSWGVSTSIGLYIMACLINLRCLFSSFR
jgi:ferritin-like protein